MRPFYWQGTTNFGDYINTWLWPKILDGHLEDDGIRLVGVGSLLKSSLNYLEGSKVVFGAGSGYGEIPNPKHYNDWHFYFVRGPLTAECFGLDPSRGIIDGSWLISQIREYQTIPSKSGISFVPHWTTSETGNWRSICEMAGIRYVDPLGELQNVLTAIARSECVITESLHGAIMADYFRSPWVPVRMTPKFLPFKWADWFASIEMSGALCKLPLSDMFEYLYCGDSRKNISYDVDFESIMYELAHEDPADEAHLNADMAYKTKIMLKAKARSIRSHLLKKCSAMRNGFFMGHWNRTHQEQLSKSLLKLASGRMFLSSDIVRKRKIDQLAEVVDTLKQDHLAGKLEAQCLPANGSIRPVSKSTL